MASWARSRSSCSDGRRTPARTSRRHATLRAPWNERVPPHYGGPVEGPLQVDRRLVRLFCSCILSQLWTGVTTRLGPFLGRVSFHFDPLYEREIVFESRFAFSVKDALFAVSSTFVSFASSFRRTNRGGLRRGFTTITRTQGWRDTHRRLTHDSFVGDSAARSAKSGTSEWREVHLSARRAWSSRSVQC